MTAILLSLVLGASPFVVPPPTGGPFQMPSTATDMGIVAPNRSDDANGRNLTIHPSNVWAGAAAAKTPGNLVLAGGLDSKTAVFADNAGNPDTAGHCPGTTQTITINGTLNNLPYNTYCSGGCATGLAAATALANAVTALTTATGSVGAITGGAARAVFAQAVQPATVSISWGASDACITTSNGTDGSVEIAVTGSSTNPSISALGDPNTGIYFGLSDYLQITTGGTRAIYFNSGNAIVTNKITAGTDVQSAGLITTTLQADLTAGACTAGTWKVDTGGVARELCRCNDGGTAYDCITITNANGPTD